MSEYKLKPSVLFWILAIVFVIWNLIGCRMYVMEMTMSDKAYAEAFGSEVAAVRDVFPVWGLSAYAIAVWSGLLAAILFLLRRRLSALIFPLSLFAAIISFIPSFVNATLREAYGPTFWVMPAIVTFIGIVEVIYSRKQATKGILR